MSQEQLAAIAGAVLSLLFNYLPFLNTWYAGLGEVAKRGVMFGLMAVVAVGVFGASCVGLGSFLGIDVVCDAQGAWELLVVLLSAVIGNQAVYLISPQTRAVKAAKA